jgi:hypothetical protein
MANEKRPPESPGTKRLRPPTVIDLSATEVPSESATAEPQAEASPPADPVPPEAAAAPPSEAQPFNPTAFDPNPTVLPSADTALPPSDPEPPRTDPPSAEPPTPPPPPEQPPSERRPPFAVLPPSASWPVAGIAGVAGALVVALLFWLFGALSGGHDGSADLSPRLAAIEKQLNELTARPAPAGVDPKAVDDLATRLAKLESAQSAPRAPVTDPVVLGRINAAESATKSLADNAAALSRRAEAADAALRETNSRIEKLTAALADVQTTARAAAAGSDRASRLAVAASALRNAVEHGDPFTAELAIVKPLAPDANAIALLEPFAASGVPGNAALGQELAAIVRPLLRASDQTPADAGFLDRLQANAQKLVRVRPVDEEPRGDDRTAILSRIEQRASQGNVATAMTELNKLPADARAPMQAWIAKAEARNRALDASRRLAADAIVALKAAP